MDDVGFVDEGEFEPVTTGLEPGDHKRIIEALILVAPEPISAATIAELTGLEEGEIESVIDDISRELLSRRSGIQIRKLAGGYGFYTCPEAAPYIESFIRSRVNPRLTQAALETLAIVAYLQPVSRGTVAAIRGIQSEGVIKTLVERDLVEDAGKGDPPGYPYLYRTTTRFMERFGLESLSDLPPLEQFIPDSATLERIRESLSWELIKGQSGMDETYEIGKGTENTGEGGPGITEEV